MKKISRESRFAVLFHELPSDEDRKSHWDLLLEPPKTNGGFTQKLITFEVFQSPEWWETEQECRRLEDHRSLYLDYEGPISGGRGIVSKVCSGTCIWTSTDSLPSTTLPSTVAMQRIELPSATVQMQIIESIVRLSWSAYYLRFEPPRELGASDGLTNLWRIHWQHAEP